MCRSENKIVSDIGDDKKRGQGLKIGALDI